MATSQTQRRCLIIERHSWETGGTEQQLQIPLAAAEDFFGAGTVPRRIRIRLFLPANANEPALTKEITVSRTYQNGTRRINGFAEIGGIASCFIFFQETDSPGVYDVWWIEDKAIIAARYHNWQQGLNSQYGRGRLATIVTAPVDRTSTQV